jgi:heptosyltransferase-3
LHTYFDIGNLLKVSCLSAGIEPIDETPRFDPGPEAVRAVDALGLPERFVAIHCVSNDPVKNWPATSWDAATDFITNTLGWPIVELGLAPMTEGAKNGRYHNLCGTISILAVAEVIRRASLFVGVDSGLAHFANAAGTPGVLLFGTFIRWQHYMPYSGRYANGTAAIILRAQGSITDLSVAEVTSAVRQRIGHAHATGAESMIGGGGNTGTVSHAIRKDES